MRTPEEIEEVFSIERHDAISRLAYWTFEELYELKNEYEYYYNNFPKTYDLPCKIKRLKDAITIKQGDEEEIWDSLT